MDLNLPQEPQAVLRDRVARDWIARGWRVLSVPLSGVDAMVARTALAGTGATLVPFNADPAVTVRRIASCERFIASRFHAHVFALATGTPVHSIASAYKCYGLWTELNLPAEAQVNRVSVVTDPEGSRARLLDETFALTLPEEERARLSAEALDAARETFRVMKRAVHGA